MVKPKLLVSLSGVLLSASLLWAAPAEAAAGSYAEVTISAFTNASKTTPLTLAALAPGAAGWLRVQVRNSGSTTWTNSGSEAVTLAGANPNDRPSPFADLTSWLSPSRPVRLLESSVPPTGFGTFEFAIVAPASPGTYNESFTLVSGADWLSGPTVSVSANVVQIRLVPLTELSVAAAQGLIANRPLSFQFSLRNDTVVAATAGLIFVAVRGPPASTSTLIARVAST